MAQRCQLVPRIHSRDNPHRHPSHFALSPYLHFPFPVWLRPRGTPTTVAAKRPAIMQSQNEFAYLAPTRVPRHLKLRGHHHLPHICSKSSKYPSLHGAPVATVRDHLQRENDPIEKHRAQGSVHLVGTGPGDPGLLTLAAVELMRNAHIVLYDRLVSDAIMKFVSPAAERICVGKGRGVGTDSQPSIQKQLAIYAAQGKRVVRLKGGDPSMFGRVGSELAYLREHHIRVDVTAGITTASGVASSLGFPLTHGGIADGVCMVTAHLDASWVTPELVKRLTLVVYMGLQELPTLLDHLNKGIARNQVAAIAVQSATTPEEKVVYGTTHNIQRKIAVAHLQSPTIVIIGNTVRMASEWAE